MKADDPHPLPLNCAPIWPLSVAGYRVLGESALVPKNTELLYGFVYRKPAKTPFHFFLVQSLRELLLQALPSGLILRLGQPLTCGESEPEPDLAVITGEEADFIEDHPHTAELVIEVSITSHEYDRSKLRAYAAAGVKECWLVLGPEKQIEVYRAPANGAFAETMVIGPGGSVASKAVAGLIVELDALFAK